MVSAIHQKRKLQCFFVPLILIEALVFGCRGALMWILLCGILIFGIEIFELKSRKKTIGVIVMLPLIAMSILAILVWLIPELLQSKYAKSSYILLRLSMGSLSESNARQMIMGTCLEAIKRMGLNINGLFYDRTILPHGMYSHNFFIESIISFGWIYGGTFVLLTIVKIIKAFLRQSFDGRICWGYFVTVLFLRYMISGSAFAEGKFAIFMASMIALARRCPRRSLAEE